MSVSDPQDRDRSPFNRCSHFFRLRGQRILSEIKFHQSIQKERMKIKNMSNACTNEIEKSLINYPFSIYTSLTPLYRRFHIKQEVNIARRKYHSLSLFLCLCDKSISSREEEERQGRGGRKLARAWPRYFFS